MDFLFLKKLWCCVGGRDENKNWVYVLSNELIKVELPPWKVLKADILNVSPSSEEDYLKITNPGLVAQSLIKLILDLIVEILTVIYLSTW